MKKHYKKRRVDKVFPILKNKIEEDIKNFKATKRRTLGLWLDIINLGLCKQDKIRNVNELVSVFKKLTHKLVIQKSIGVISPDNYKVLKTYYKIELK